GIGEEGLVWETVQGRGKHGNVEGRLFDIPDFDDARENISPYLRADGDKHQLIKSFGIRLVEDTLFSTYPGAAFNARILGFNYYFRVLRRHRIDRKREIPTIRRIQIELHLSRRIGYGRLPDRWNADEQLPREQAHIGAYVDERDWLIADTYSLREL